MNTYKAPVDELVRSIVFHVMAQVEKDSRPFYNSCVNGDREWPAHCEFAVTYAPRKWSWYVEYFATQDEMETWIQSQPESVVIGFKWKWDLGAQRMN